MSMYRNQCMINSMMLNSFKYNAGIRQLTDVLKKCLHMHFCRSCFFSHGFIQMCFGHFEFFLFLFYEKQILSKFNTIKVSLTEDIFSLGTQFFIDENIRKEI